MIYYKKLPILTSNLFSEWLPCGRPFKILFNLLAAAYRHTSEQLLLGFDTQSEMRIAVTDWPFDSKVRVNIQKKQKKKD